MFVEDARNKNFLKKPDTYPGVPITHSINPLSITLINIHYWILVRSPRDAVDLSRAVGVLRQRHTIYILLKYYNAGRRYTRSHTTRTNIIINVTREPDVVRKVQLSSSSSLSLWLACTIIVLNNRHARQTRCYNARHPVLL